MPALTIRIFDIAALSRRNVLVLELDTPAPIVGLTIGMPVTLAWSDGSRAEVLLKGLGFASSTPEHAHLIVSAPIGREDVEGLTHIEVDPDAPVSKPKDSRPL